MNPVDLIIFGATGDLSARKLFPALFQLDAAGLLPLDLRIAAVARQEQSIDSFQQDLRSKMAGHMRQDIDERVWERFAGRFSYLSADFSEPQAFEALQSWLDDARVSLFYLATPPSLFATICEQLSQDGCLTGPCRIVLRNPLARALRLLERSTTRWRSTLTSATSIVLITTLAETVQNLLVLRFANRFINRNGSSCIDRMQITVAEKVGIEVAGRITTGWVSSRIWCKTI